MAQDSNSNACRTVLYTSQVLAQDISLRSDELMRHTGQKNSVCLQEHIVRQEKTDPVSDGARSSCIPSFFRRVSGTSYTLEVKSVIKPLC